jgi:hypothetical protein
MYISHICLANRLDLRLSVGWLHNLDNDVSARRRGRILLCRPLNPKQFNMARRPHLTLMVGLVIFAFLSISYLMSGSSTARYPQAELLKQADDRTDIAREATKGDFGLPSSILTGGAIAPKLENKTAK